MDIAFAEIPAFDLGHLVYDDERLGVDLVDDFFHLPLLEPVDDARDLVIALFRISALNLVERSAPSEPVPHRLDHDVRYARDDFERLRPAQSFLDDMNHFRGDEVGDCRQDRSLQAEHRRDDDEDEHVQEENQVARPERQLPRQQDGQHVNAVERAPRSGATAPSRARE